MVKIFGLTLLFSLLYSSTIALTIGGPSKREIKTEEILSETSAKAWEKWMKFTLNQIIKEKKFDLI